VEADVSGFVDTLDRRHLRELIKQRVNDGGILRLLGKWLNAGVLEAGALSYPDKGTPQGGVASPLLANIFLHHVLDEWCVTEVPPRMKGRGFLTRLADDCIIGCESKTEAQRVMAVLPKRFGRFNLTIHPEKMALIGFNKPLRREHSARGKGTFDLLGFTHYWAKTRRGYWVIKRKTVGKRLRRLMQGIGTWCRENRHAPLPEQERMRWAKLRGYDHYQGIRGNLKALRTVLEHTRRAWRYWLSRRRHKGPLDWQKYEASVRYQCPFPKPRIMHTIERCQGQHRGAPNGVKPVWFVMGESLWLLRNRRRETCTSGSVGRALGNQCLYPASVEELTSTIFGVKNSGRIAPIDKRLQGALSRWRIHRVVV
jgi:RNA-directed DNA polymerase